MSASPFITPLALTILVACSSSTPLGVPDDPDPPDQPPLEGLTLTVASGSSGQNAVAGDPLARPLVVKVTRDGQPVPGVAIGWMTHDGVVSPLRATTDPSGNAQATWALGERDGPQEAEAWIRLLPEVSAKFSANAWPRLLVTQRALGIGQTAPVGSSVTVELRAVGAFDGQPRAGVPVSWTGNGGFAPAVTATDASGIAVTRWTLPTHLGPLEAHATVRGSAVTPPLRLNTTPGPAVQVILLRVIDTIGTNWTVPVTASAYAIDAFGNPSTDSLEWIVTGESLSLLTTERWGTHSRAHLLATGIAGTSHFRVRLPATGAVASGELVTRSAYPAVKLDTDGAYRFVSMTNGSSPAVDTVASGAPLRWWLSPFDYELHTINIAAAWGSAGGGMIPYQFPSMLITSLTVLGTYTYTDDLSGATGTVVVVP